MEGLLIEEKSLPLPLQPNEACACLTVRVMVCVDEVSLVLVNKTRGASDDATGASAQRREGFHRLTLALVAKPVPC